MMLILHQIILQFYSSKLFFKEEYEKPIMTIGDKIRDEKVSYDVKREAIKISALSS